MMLKILYAPDVPVGGCISVEGGRIGYCCLFADVAYAFVSALLRNHTIGKIMIGYICILIFG